MRYPSIGFLGTALLVPAFMACGAEEQMSALVAPNAGAGGGGIEGSIPSREAGPQVCPDASGVYSVEPAQSNLLFLVDRSGSMHLRVGKNGDTRWSLTKAGLVEVFDALPEATVGGVSLFPAGDQPITCCSISAANTVTCKCAAGALPGPEERCDSTSYLEPSVPLAPLDAMQLDEMKSAIATVDDEFYWGTPLTPALKGAIDSLAAMKLPGVSSIVLLTDGQPTSCDTKADPGANDIQRAIDAAIAGSDLAIRTYVVGVYDTANGANPEYLSFLAAAAGTGRYAGCEANQDCAYPVNAETFSSDFAAAMESIALDAMTCSFDLPHVEGGAPDYDKVNLTITTNGTSITVPQDTNHSDGWDYLGGKKQVQLYGSACELLKNDGSAKVEIVVGCETIGG